MAHPASQNRVKEMTVIWLFVTGLFYIVWCFYYNYCCMHMLLRDFFLHSEIHCSGDHMGCYGSNLFGLVRARQEPYCAYIIALAPVGCDFNSLSLRLHTWQWYLHTWLWYCEASVLVAKTVPAGLSCFHFLVIWVIVQCPWVDDFKCCFGFFEIKNLFHPKGDNWIAWWFYY